MMPHICHWGLYLWFVEYEPELVHPDDLDQFRNFKPYGHVFHCIGKDLSYLILQYGDSRFRVKPDLFRPVPPPRHIVGEVVSVARDNGIVTAVVCDVMWHFKKSKPYYHVAINGKRSGRQYWDEDLDVARR
jgi:hypothetical protein